MIHKLILVLNCALLLLIFSSCEKSQDTGFVGNRYDFQIDSIYDITQTTATIKATLFKHTTGLKITGLSVVISKNDPLYSDSLFNDVFFNKSEGTVVMTVDNLESNTLYYVWPRVYFSNRGRNDEATSDPKSMRTFTTKLQTNAWHITFDCLNK